MSALKILDVKPNISSQKGSLYPNRSLKEYHQRTQMHTFMGKSPKTAQIIVSQTSATGTFYVETPLTFKTFGADLRRWCSIPVACLKGVNIRGLLTPKSGKKEKGRHSRSIADLQSSFLRPVRILRHSFDVNICFIHVRVNGPDEESIAVADV